MVIDPMTRRECDDLLARIGFGSLACAKENQPYIVPIYFAHQPDRLYGFSTFGRKIEWMRSNSQVCVQVDELSGPEDWASVIATGQYEELPDVPEYAKAREWAESLLKRRSCWWEAGYAASAIRTQPFAHAPILYCIHIREISGLRASAGERIVEKWNLGS